METWKKYLKQALKNLSGVAHLSGIYEEAKKAFPWKINEERLTVVLKTCSYKIKRKKYLF